MLKKLLSRVGIGSAKIDLVLDKDVITMGETVTGKIFVTGGGVEQDIGNISVDLRVKSSYKKGDNTHYVDDAVATVKVTDGFKLTPEEKREFPISFQVPEGIPVSMPGTKFYFKTNLDIKEALDSTDKDIVTVLPSGLMKNFLDGIKELGFVHHTDFYTGKLQAIEFKPTSYLAGKLSEVEFRFEPARSKNEITGNFEVEKKGSGLMGMLADELDLNETKGHFCFTANDLATVDKAKDTIRSFIDKNYHP